MLGPMAAQSDRLPNFYPVTWFWLAWQRGKRPTCEFGVEGLLMVSEAMTRDESVLVLYQT